MVLVWLLVLQKPLTGISKPCEHQSPSRKLQGPATPANSQLHLIAAVHAPQLHRTQRSNLVGLLILFEKGTVKMD